MTVRRFRVALITTAMTRSMATRAYVELDMPLTTPAPTATVWHNFHHVYNHWRRGRRSLHNFLGCRKILRKYFSCLFTTEGPQFKI